ncbi:hypothetical protein BFI47_10355, partial [Yersinia pestis subsp. microtus bv. Altaica]
FKTFSQFSRKCFKFLFVHNLPVSVVGVKISKTGNYTILFTVSGRFCICRQGRLRYLLLPLLKRYRC